MLIMFLSTVIFAVNSETVSCWEIAYISYIVSYIYFLCFLEQATETQVALIGASKL